MVQAKIQTWKKIKWTEMIIALVLASFGIYFLVSGFVLQSSSGLIIPIISYIIGLGLLLGAKMYKRKAIEAQ